ncbi:MAG TPA: tripartite tricarboxylate transporter substrate binding protein [Xanthobacteraceae bacterium]|jgi:tripartite-type tricarboxylate transporter receptor subunit TctC
MNRLLAAACLWLWAALGVVAMVLTAAAAADAFPARPIRLIMPYSPGGIVDFAGRVLAQKLGDALGQTVVAENRPGAGGIVGVDFVAHSAPDGYDIVIIDPAVVINPTLQKSLPYDIFKDLVTISIINSSPEVLVVAPQLGVNTYAQLVSYGKANPGKLNFASAGVGTTPHLAAEMWALRTGIRATHVPYKGVGPSFVDLMSGKVQMLFSSIAGALPFTSKGSVIPLATTGLERSPVYPDLPTVAEAGIPGYDVDLWLGVYGPAGMPPDVLATLNNGIAQALKDDELKSAFAKFGLTPRGTSLAEGAAWTRSEYEKWKKVITDGHIALD